MTPAMVAFAEKLSSRTTLVSCRRSARSLPPRAGSTLSREQAEIKEAVERLQDRGIHVSLFIDPETAQIETSKQSAPTPSKSIRGTYCNAVGPARQRRARQSPAAARLAQRLGLEVHGGHGLDYDNVFPIARSRKSSSSTSATVSSPAP